MLTAIGCPKCLDSFAPFLDLLQSLLQSSTSISRLGELCPIFGSLQSLLQSSTSISRLGTRGWRTSGGASLGAESRQQSLQHSVTGIDYLVFNWSFLEHWPHVKHQHPLIFSSKKIKSFLFKAWDTFFSYWREPEFEITEVLKHTPSFKYRRGFIQHSNMC